MSDYFRDARDFIVTGSNFSHVKRDQYNYNGPTMIIQNQEKERTEFDEYHYVKRGAICRLKNIHTTKYLQRQDAGDEGWWDIYQAERTICTASILEQPGKMFTVMEYSGPERRKLFEEDFRRFTRASTSDIWQVYGYNDSNIPMLISYN
ncbi:hypothetical protein PQX77_003634, partial [Marasmius sp. AFHP31]